MWTEDGNGEVHHVVVVGEVLSGKPLFRQHECKKGKLNMVARNRRFKAAEPGGDEDRVKFQDLAGSLLLVTPKEKGVHDYQGTPSKYTVSDVVVLDGEGAGETFEDMWVFGAYLQGQLKVGDGPVLGRLGKSDVKIGKGKPWILSEPTDEDVVVANDYFDSLEDEAPSAKADTSLPPWKRNKK